MSCVFDFSVVSPAVWSSKSFKLFRRDAHWSHTLDYAVTITCVHNDKGDH